MNRLKPLAVTVLLATAIPCAGASPAWTSFQNGGQSVAASTIDADWRPNAKPVWSAEIEGYGQSSPVVFNDRIYVTSVSGPNKEKGHVTAFQVSNGKPLWQQTLKMASTRESNNYVSRAAPTPVVSESGIVSLFEGGSLHAISLEGKLLWERDLIKEYGEIDARHGIGASLEQDAEAVYVWVERSKDPYVMRINKLTGKTEWKVAGVGATSWSSPRIVPVAKGAHLLLSGSGSVIGLDPKTGRKLWTLDDVSGNTSPTPMPLGESRFLVGATVGRGVSDSGPAAASNGVVEITQSADGEWSAKYVWRAKRATSSFGSPVAHDGRAWFVNRAGVLYSLDLKDGTERKAARIGGSIWATPIGVKGALLFPLKDGSLEVIKTEGKFELVSSTTVFDKKPPADGRPSFGGPVLYAAVVVGDVVVIRTGNRLICLAGQE